MTIKLEMILNIHQIFVLFSLVETEEDYDAFCLAYMFTYRDFEMGTLGLAWTGDLKNAGGVCEKNGVRISHFLSKPFFANEITKFRTVYSIIVDHSSH